MSRSVPRRICTLAGTATLALAASAASGQITCACDNLIPPGYQIADCRQNEDGGNPTHVVGFGATTTMRHANFFQPGITITHVCVHLVQTVTHAEVQFRDDAGGLPGGVFHAEAFAISPNSNGFQPIQLNTALMPGDTVLIRATAPLGHAARVTGLGIDYTTVCVGDLNDDGVVDIQDIFECLATWGLPGGCDINVLFDILANWGPCP